MNQTEEKKTYEKPSIVYRQSMESVATACDPNANGKGDDMCTVLNS
jgi:hypothetical protein